MPAKRVLCLGNELLADDGLGALVAARLQAVAPPDTEIVFSEENGLRLIDYVQGVSLLVVVDSIASGQFPPGAVRVLSEQECKGSAGAAPHYVGLFDVLALARSLALPVPDRVCVVAVEAADTLTIGGRLTPAVEACIPQVVEQVVDICRYQ